MGSVLGNLMVGNCQIGSWSRYLIGILIGYGFWRQFYGSPGPCGAPGPRIASRSQPMLQHVRSRGVLSFNREWILEQPLWMLKPSKKQDDMSMEKLNLKAPKGHYHIMLGVDETSWNMDNGRRYSKARANPLRLTRAWIGSQA